MKVNLSNQQGLDAHVEAASTRRRDPVRMVDLQGRPVESRRVLRGTIEGDLAALLAQYGPHIEDVGEVLAMSDPEIDLERAGLFLSDTARVFIDQDGEVCRLVVREEIVYGPDGEERERREVQVTEGNVALDQPLTWTGKRIPKEEAVRRFVFSSTLQLLHVNGLTFDFLATMARDLASTGELLVLGAGARGQDPLVLQRGGRPYRGFLEGRVEGEAYLLLLHLSNLELKPLG